jgi:ubiquinone/menaquinone biosynthesis C-methylase UbiE
MDNKKRRVLSHYERTSKRYSDLFEIRDDLAVYPTATIRVQKALRLAKTLHPSGHVLDVGCGFGLGTREFLGAGYTVCGVDISPNMITEAKTRTEASGFSSSLFEFKVGDVESLGLPDAHFDIVIALGLIEYLESHDQFFEEIKRVLRPNGIAIIAFRNRLFNLFGLNSQSTQDIMDYEPRAFFETTLRELNQAAQEDQIGNFIARLRLLPNPNSEFSQELRNKETKIRQDRKIPLRQYAPDEIRDISSKFGFRFLEMRYFHFHPFPPYYEKVNPQAFNALGVAMECLDQTGIGALMASGFVAAIKKSH